MRAAKRRREIADIDERVGRKDQIVEGALLGERGFEIGDGEAVVDSARARLLDHARRKIDAVEAAGHRRKHRPGEAGAAAEIENVERLWVS